MPDTNFVMERLEFMKLDRKAQDDIRRLKPVLDKQLPDALGKFYAHISGVPQVARFFTDAEHMARAKKNQIGHWLNIAAADFGDDYGRSVRIVGETHARIGLEPRWYIGGYAVIADLLIKACAEHLWPRELIGRSGKAEVAGAALGALLGGLITAGFGAAALGDSGAGAAFGTPALGVAVFGAPAFAPAWGAAVGAAVASGFPVAVAVALASSLAAAFGAFAPLTAAMSAETFAAVAFTSASSFEPAVLRLDTPSVTSFPADFTASTSEVISDFSPAARPAAPFACVSPPMIRRIVVTTALPCSTALTTTPLQEDCWIATFSR